MLPDISLCPKNFKNFPRLQSGQASEVPNENRSGHHVNEILVFLFVNPLDTVFIRNTGKLKKLLIISKKSSNSGRSFTTVIYLLEGTSVNSDFFKEITKF